MESLPRTGRPSEGVGAAAVAFGGADGVPDPDVVAGARADARAPVDRSWESSSGAVQEVLRARATNTARVTARVCAEVGFMGLLQGGSGAAARCDASRDANRRYNP